MLKRLRHKIERKVASKQPIQFRYDLVVSSIEGLVMDTKEVEISVSWSRGGKRKKSTSWRLVYPGESCAYFDEELTQPGVTLYRDQKPPYVFEEKEYDIKVLAKYVELGQVVNQVIGSHVIDLAKFATSETNFTSNETFKIPLKYRGFTNNVASLKVIVKSCWLKNLSGKDMDQISESLTQFSETSTSNYQSAMTHLPEQSQQQQPQGQQSKTPLSAQSSASSHKPLEVEKDSVSMYSGNSFKSDRLGNAMKADSGRSKRDQEGVAQVARTCESTIDTILDDFGKFNFEVDGKIDELLLSAQSAEKKLEKIKKKVGNVHQLKSQMKLLEDAKEARDSKFNEELEKANKQIEFLKQETLISETRVGNLKKAMQEKEAELQQYKEKAKNAQEQLPPSEEQREKSSLATDRGSKENEEWSLKVNTLIQQVQNLEAELDAANTKLAQAPMPVGADSRADNMELNRKVKKLEDELLNKEEELEDYELTVGSLKAQIAAGAPQENAEQEQSLQREKLMSLEQELAAIKQQKEFAEKSATDLQQSVKELEGKLSEQTQEVASSNQNVASLTAQIASLTQANDAVDGNVSALKQAHEEELKKLQSEVDALQQGRDGHNESLAELEKHFESEKELTAKLQNTISALEEDVSTKSESLQESLLKVGTLTATIESLTEERDGMVANASQAGDSVSELQAKLDSEKSLASDLQKSLETLEEKLSHKEEELEDYELTVGSLKAQVAALSSTVLQQEQVEAQQENAEQEQSLQREKLMSLEQELAAIKQQKEAAEKSATDLQQSVKELEGKLSEQTQEVASSNQNVASLTAQIASLTQANDAVDGNVSALKQAHEEELKKLQSEVDALQQGRDGHNESLAELEKHFESEKELTAKLQNTISALEEDVSTKSESLQESLLKVGTLTATIESLTEERDGMVANASQAGDSVSELQAKLDSEKSLASDLQKSLETLEEKLSHKEEELEDYELTVGSLKAQVAALSSTVLQQEQVEAQQENAEQEQSLQREKLMSLEQELAAIKQQKEAAEKSATDLQQSVKELEGKLSEQTQEVASSNQNVASLTAQIASLTQANDAVDGNVSALKQAHEEELKKLQSEVDALQQGRDGHNESLAELEKHFESEKELTAKLQNTISALEEDVSTKSESLQESLLKVGTLTATIESLTEERDGVHSEKLKNLEKELLLKEEEYQSTVESLKAQVAALSKTPDVAEQPASGSFEEIDIGGEKPVSSDDTRAQIELKDRVKALEEELTHKKEQLSHKEEELEDYELTVGSLKSQLAALSSQTTENADASASKEALQQDLEKQQKENDLEVAALKARVGELEAELQFMTLANEEEKSTEKVKPVEESAPEESSLCVNAKEMEKEKDAMLAELIKQKTQLQEENSFLIGELTEAKIELAEMKMR